MVILNIGKFYYIGTSSFNALLKIGLIFKSALTMISVFLVNYALPSIKFISYLNCVLYDLQIENILYNKVL